MVFPGGGLVSGVPVFEVRLLGPVQAARAGREVPLGGPRQRAVLALLVLEAGRVVLGLADRGIVAGRSAAGGGHYVAVVCVAAAVGAGAGGAGGRAWRRVCGRYRP